MPLPLLSDLRSPGAAEPAATEVSWSASEALPLSAKKRSSNGRECHGVLFFTSESMRRDAVASFAADALRTGQSAIVLMAKERHAGILDVLSRQGVDVAAELASQSLQLIDSHQALAQILRDEMPSAEAVTALVEHHLVKGRPDGDYAQVRVYGELVDVLQGSNRSEAALRLEQLWTALQGRHHFSLLCGYAIEHFHEHPEAILSVCEEHDPLQPSELVAESPTMEDWPAESSLSGLSQHALLLARETIQRRAAEKALLSSLDKHDTSERRRSQVQEALEQSEGYLRTITDAVPMLVCYIDREQRYRFANTAYERWFGMDPRSMLGRSVRDVFGEDPHAQWSVRIAAALTGQTQSFRENLPYGHGPFVEANYFPHVGPDGRVEGFVGVTADISDHRRMELARTEALERTARLIQITTALVEAVTPTQVFEAVVDQVAATLKASSGALFALDDDSRHMRLLHSIGYGEAAREKLRTMPVDSPFPVPVQDALRTGIPLWFASQGELLAAYPHLGAMVSPGRNYQIACLPIFVQRRSSGAVAFTFDDAKPLDVEQQNFLLLVARYSGQALERLRLLEAERKSRERAEAVALRADILSRASRVLTESGDEVYGQLQVIAEQVANEYCDLCSVYLEAESRLDLVALHHRRPEVTIQLRAALQVGSLDPTRDVFRRLALTGKTVALTAAELQAAVATAPPEYQAWLQCLNSGSVISVPLRTRGEAVGALCFMKEASSGEFGTEDTSFFEELSERIAIGIESDRLYRAHQQSRARTELLYALAQTVIVARDREQVYDAALDTLEQALGTPRSAILTFDKDPAMCFRAWRGLSDEYRAAVEGHSPWARDESNAEPIFIEDVRRDASLAPLLPVLAKEGIGALGFIPLVSAGELLGKFMIYYDGPRKLVSHELDMAKTIANHVAVAVSRFQAVDELLKTVRFNDVFTGILGHDLRNPLGAIMTAAQVAMRRSDGERTQKLHSRILASGTRMSRMIDQLLDFTRVRVGNGIPVERQELDLLPLLRQVIDEFDDAHPQCAMRLEHVGATRGFWDPDRLAQVFSNLIANAVQHGEATHGVLTRVDGSQPGMIRVEIHNRGVVPPEVLPHLFEPMAGATHRRHQSQGLGLGLYISQQIVKAHGGHIEVTSQEPTGTVLAVTLLSAAESTGPVS